MPYSAQLSHCIITNVFKQLEFIIVNLTKDKKVPSQNEICIIRVPIYTVKISLVSFFNLWGNKQNHNGQSDDICTIKKYYSRYISKCNGADVGKVTKIDPSGKNHYDK